MGKGSVSFHRRLLLLDACSLLRLLLHGLVLLSGGLSLLTYRRAKQVELVRSFRCVVKGDMSSALGWQCSDNGVGLISN